MCIEFIDDLRQLLFHEIAMISLNLKMSSTCVLVLKVYYNVYLCTCVCTCVLCSCRYEKVRQRCSVSVHTS